MKIIVSHLIILCILVSCSKNNTPSPKNIDPISVQKPITIAAPVSNSITDFSFYFFKTLQATQPETDNIFVSPLSLHIALGMLVNGAAAETKTEILKALRAENIPQTDLNNSYKKLMNELPAADSKVKLGLANSIWYKNTFSVESNFLTTMKDYFNAKVTALPFISSDVNIINQWASDHTNAKITNVLSEIKPELVMFLLNALYFKGDWAIRFDAKNTQEQPFTLQNGTTKTVKMMNNTDSFQYAGFTDYDALQIPYGNGQFRATLILPKNNNTINSVFSNFTIDKWNDLQSKLVLQKVIVAVPKFTLKQEFHLNSTLQNMGMIKAFTGFAEFNGIHKEGGIEVSFVKQNTYVSVDEEGTEAAAVTTIGVGFTSAPIITSFICNRPFAFIISEKTSNTILFMGRILSPESN
jgi:serine protease inhibitor